MKIAAIALLIVGTISAGFCTNYFIQAYNLQVKPNGLTILAFETVKIIRKNPGASERAQLLNTKLEG